MTKLAVVNIGQLVTLAGPKRPRVGAELRELGIMANAAMLIEDDRIVAVGKHGELEAQIDGATRSSPGIARMNLSGGLAGRLIRRLPRLAAEFCVR